GGVFRWTGTVTLGIDATVDVESSAAELNLAGRITDDVNQDGVSDVHGLNKTGAGTLRFSGSVANDYTGTTCVDGPLSLNKGLFTGGSVTAIKGPLDIKGSVTLVGLTDPLGHVVPGSGNNQINDDAPVTIRLRGTLNLNTHDDAIGPLTLTAGDDSISSVTTGGGLLTLLGAVTVAAGPAGLNAQPATIRGKVSLGGTGSFTLSRLATGVSLDAELVVYADITQGSLTKDGAGTMKLSAVNDYSGLTNVRGGRLEVTAPAALGTSATFGIHLTNGATLEINPS